MLGSDRLSKELAAVMSLNPDLVRRALEAIDRKDYTGEPYGDANDLDDAGVRAAAWLMEKGLVGMHLTERGKRMLRILGGRALGDES